MGLLDELRDLGVDVDAGVGRLGGNAKIYEKMLGSFLKMMKEYAVDPDFDGENYDDIIEKAHAVKGAAANLSLTPIFNAYSDVVDLLRKKQPEQARAVLTGVIPVQEKIIDAIRRHSTAE